MAEEGTGITDATLSAKLTEGFAPKRIEVIDDSDGAYGLEVALQHMAASRQRPAGPAALSFAPPVA